MSDHFFRVAVVNSFIILALGSSLQVMMQWFIHDKSYLIMPYLATRSFTRGLILLITPKFVEWSTNTPGDTKRIAKTRTANVYSCRPRYASRWWVKDLNPLLMSPTSTCLIKIVTIYTSSSNNTFSTFPTYSRKKFWGGLLHSRQRVPPSIIKGWCRIWSGWQQTTNSRTKWTQRIRWNEKIHFV